jgi:hypothetical protein
MILARDRYSVVGSDEARLRENTKLPDVPVVSAASP